MGPLQIAPDLLRARDLTAAVLIEAQNPPDLLPTSSVEAVAQAHTADIARIVSSGARRGLQVSPREYVNARKARGGSRPVPILTFEERVLARAFSEYFRSRVATEVANPTTYEQMSDGPIEVGQPWVAHADVASFYQYVDHNFLEDELVSSTGEALAAEGALAVLGAIMQRRFGLPQGVRSSDTFADVYIDVAERELLRSGRPAFRYSDDFRISARTRREALESIELLDSSLRNIGLTLNDDKTYITSLEAYVSWRTQPETLVDDFENEAWSELLTVDLYDGEVLEVPSAEAVWSEAAVKALAWWRDHYSGVSPAGAEGLIVRRVLQRSLAVLSTLANTGAVEFAPAILDREPQLTPQLSRYLAEVAPQLDGETSDLILAIGASDGAFLNSWQLLWLLESIHKSADIGGPLSERLRGIVAQSRVPGITRAAAGALLVRHQLMSVDDAVALLQDLQPEAQPNVVAALAQTGKLKAAHSKLLRSNALHRLVFDHYQIAVGR